MPCEEPRRAAAPDICGGALVSRSIALWLFGNWEIKMKNAGPKKKAGRKPKQKNALAKANAERKAAALKKKKTENKLLLPSVAPAKPPIPGSQRSPPWSSRPPTNETEVYSVINSTPTAPLSLGESFLIKLTRFAC
jgi:hypothetical protein